MHKAFILGAGLGTRLQPLTSLLPKPLIPVFNRPLTEHALDHCIAAGIQDFAINTHHLPKSWPEAFPGNEYRSRSIEFFHESSLLETGGGLKNIAPFVGDSSTLVYNGDILTNIDLTELIKRHRASGCVATLGLRSSGPVCNIAVEGDRVIDLRHARGLHPGTHQFTGIYCIEPEILDLIPEDEKVSVVPAFLKLAEQGQLGFAVLDEGHWLDLGERESYLDVHSLTGFGAQIHPSAIVEAGANISNSVIGADCRIQAGASIKNSVIWPGGTVMSDAEIDRCVVYSSNPASGVHVNADI